MSDLISVIVPVYNVEKYIEKCIYSIINQTYSNLEIILVDDGSTDSSGYLCDKIKKYDSRVKVIHEKNGGVSEARNCGLKNATGKYIGFVDSDDYIESDMYETLYRLIIENNADISMVSYFYENNNEKIVINDNKEKEIFDNHEGLKQFLLDKKIKDLLWNKLYNKKIFEGIQFPKGKNYEDVVVSFRLFEKCNKSVLLNEPKYHYIKRENSIVTTMNTKNCVDFLDAIYYIYINCQNKHEDLIEYMNYNYIKAMIWMCPIILKNNLNETLEEYNRNYKIMESMMEKSEKNIVDKLDDNRKSTLYWILDNKWKK